MMISYGDALEGQVWFGVGTFGTSEDEMRGLGNCYRYVHALLLIPATSK